MKRLIIFVSAFLIGLITTASGFQTQSAGNLNTATGHQALVSNTEGSYNTANGYQALYSNSTGAQNTATGSWALYSNKTGLQNTATGSGALESNTIGVSNTANGYQALSQNKEGNNNTANGYNALQNALSSNNTAVGYKALLHNVTGDNNTAFGFFAGPHVGNKTLVNTTAIGFRAEVKVNNQVSLGNKEITSLNCMGAYQGIVGSTPRDLYVDSNGKIGYVSSSSRYKADINNLGNIEWLFKLRPVNFTYKNDIQDLQQYGLIAEEVEKVNPDFVDYNHAGQVETVSYSKLISPMLKAIQDQQKEISVLETQINSQDEIIATMKKEIETIKALLKLQ